MNVRLLGDEATERPKVSVCLQTYQHAPYIAEAIESVLMQDTEFPIELLIGEDESSDGTREICREYARRIPQIRLALNSRANNIRVHGQATGRANFLQNLGRARGQYIALLPGDDFWTDPKKLALQAEVLDANPDIVACHHWYRRIYEAPLTGPEDPRQGYNSRTITSLEDIFANRVRIKARTVMFRNVIDEHFFPPWFRRVAYGDVPLSMLLGAHGDFHFLDRVMATYRITGKGVSGSGSPQRGSLRHLLRAYRNWAEIWRLADRHYQGRYREQTQTTLREMRHKLARRYVRAFGQNLSRMWRDPLRRSARR